MINQMNPDFTSVVQSHLISRVHKGQEEMINQMNLENPDRSVWAELPSEVQFDIISINNKRQTKVRKHVRTNCIRPNNNPPRTLRLLGALCGKD